MTGRRPDHGMVTAELAVITPFGLAFVVLLAWVVGLGHTQVRLTDAAREAARVVARGDSVADATDVARRNAPDGATVEVDEQGGLITVTVRAGSGIALPGLADVGRRELSATVTAAAEDP
ncbi:TadE-like protein [Aeromicrobium marinum DSM 15272]|uniref:TadE-like protein n=1 Tax=Aeromicrobium marinum DSM 15272 TaxID=585531 RepID=E2SFI5_9ACTN|nr:TadE family type IV pilus minor pilin [Aeromicrobium marinum]EFQ82086.1 TadE-like protein [Aeromicrobium marinum DSM 15272]